MFGHHQPHCLILYDVPVLPGAPMEQFLDGVAARDVVLATYRQFNSSMWRCRQHEAAHPDEECGDCILFWESQY